MDIAADPRRRFAAEFRVTSLEDCQTLAECGAVFRGRDLYAGELKVEFQSAGADAFGTDGYRLQRRGGTVQVAASTRAARLSALLAVPELVASRGATLTRRLRFHRRFYKHEIVRPGKRGAHAVTRYTARFWADLCRELVRRHFNGIAIYTDLNPFTFLGDYGRHERYAAVPAEARAENRAHFNVFLSTARRYGLETLLQQYISKLPGELARDVGFPYYMPKDIKADIADFRHPDAYAFLRDQYVSFFAQLPGLDRLMVNFEAASNSTDFCREVLLPVLGGMKRPPALLFRLWYMTLPETLCRWIAEYPGHSMVSHKVMDTMDAYLYPCADSRIREWKDAFAAHDLEVEWNYLIGPCHNCGSNISRRLWSDAEFVYRLVNRIRAVGSDGFNFHTRVELLADTFDSGAVIDESERALARMNRGHLEAAVDVVRGGRYEEAGWIAREAERLGVPARVGRQVVAATRDSSRAAILHMEQCPLTTHEGYAADSRRQLSQHPLFHPPANVLLNRQHREGPRVLWSFISKARPGASYPEDLQTLIDYADPTTVKTARNPRVLAEQMLKLGEGSLKAATALRRHMGDAWVAEVASNRNLAVVCAHDLLAGIALFRLYFPLAPAAALRTVTASIEHLDAIRRIVRAHGAPDIHMQEPHAPEPDIAALKRLRRLLAAGYPRRPFERYAQSVKTYNDIRRHVRPWRVWSPRDLRKAGALLGAARAQAGEALAMAPAGRWQVPLQEWVDYLDRELAWLQPPTITCGAEWADWQPMTHDNCFGYGGFAWADFLGFFESIPRDKGLQQECSVRRDGEALEVSLRERGVDGRERLARWKQLEGHPDLGGIMRVLLDTENAGRRLRQWSALPLGASTVMRDLRCEGRQAHDLRAVELAPPCVTSGQCDRAGWSMTLRLPFKALGVAPPRAGDVWRLNLASNAPIKRNHAVSWCKGYEVGAGNPERMGLLRFA
jgi:hypothetical protein